MIRPLVVPVVSANTTSGAPPRNPPDLRDEVRQRRPQPEQRREWDTTHERDREHRGAGDRRDHQAADRVPSDDVAADRAHPVEAIASFGGKQVAEAVAGPMAVDQGRDRDEQDPERRQQSVADRAQRALQGTGVRRQPVGCLLERRLEPLGDAALGELVADQRELFEIGGDPRQLVVEIADALDDRRYGEHQHRRHDRQEADHHSADREPTAEPGVVGEPLDEWVERHRQHDADDDPGRNRSEVDHEGDHDDDDAPRSMPQSPPTATSRWLHLATAVEDGTRSASSGGSTGGSAAGWR